MVQRLRMELLVEMDTNSFSWNTTPVQTTNPATGLAAGNYTSNGNRSERMFYNERYYGIRTSDIVS